LKLRSTVISVTTDDDLIVIDTKGYGHRVGMSQHGADAMANNWSSYQEILMHYYKYTTLQNCK
jgi:stage II sporulation protein D